MFYYVYILKLSNGNFYTGFTKDLKKRIKSHISGKVFSTKNKRPLELVHYEAYKIKEDALRREKFLKTSDGKRFLKQQLSSLFHKLRTV